MSLDDAKKDPRLAEVRASSRGKSKEETPSDPKPDAPAVEWITRDDASIKMIQGKFFPLKPEHTPNYDALVARAGVKDTTSVQVVLDLQGENQIYASRPNEKLVVVSPADIQETPKLVSDMALDMIQKKRWTVLNETTAGNFSALAGLADGVNGEHRPTIVLLDHQSTTPKVEIQVKRAEEGGSLVIINDAAHQWTPEYARSLKKSDADLAALHNGLWNTLLPIYNDLKNAGASQEIIDYIAESAKSRGMKEPPMVLSTNLGGKNGRAEVTKEGTPYILIDPSVFKLPVDEQKFIVDHELGHLQRGDVTPERLAVIHNARNIQELVRGTEGETDKTAVCFSPNSEVTAHGGKNFFKGLIDEVESKFSANPRAKQDAYQKHSSDHPDLRQRVKDIPHYVNECSEMMPPVATPPQRWEAAGGIVKK